MKWLRRAWDATGGYLSTNLLRPGVLATAALLCLLSTLALFPLKIAQVEREAVLVARYKLWQQASPTVEVFENELLGYYRHDSASDKVRLATVKGLYRRLDDPSFWFFIATTLAGTCVFAARMAYGRTAPRLAQRHFFRFITVSTVLVVLYLVVSRKKSEVFFWSSFPEAHDPDGRHRDPTIFWIQLIEGILNVQVILIGAGLFVAAQAIYAQVRGRRGGGWRKLAALGSARGLRVCLLPHGSPILG
jgi:hypothetical protein